MERSVLYFFLLPFSFPPAPHHHTTQTKWSYRRHWCCLRPPRTPKLHPPVSFLEPPSIAPSLMRRSLHSLRSKSLPPPSDNSHNTGEFRYEKRISAREWFKHQRIFRTFGRSWSRGFSDARWTPRYSWSVDEFSDCSHCGDREHRRRT